MNGTSMHIPPTWSNPWSGAFYAKFRFLCLLRNLFWWFLFIIRSFFTYIYLWIVFCCYNCLDLPWEKFFQVWVTFFPSSWEQEYCVEKRLCKLEAIGREFVTFSRHYSCLRELGKQVTNTWKNFEHDTNLDNYSNRMFFLIFLELHLLDLCVGIAVFFQMAL